MRWVMRGVALAHFAWGFLLLLLTTHFAFGVLRMLPRLSSGSTGTNLPVVLPLAGANILPLAALGVWMIVLGRWTWTMRPGLRRVLLVTHSVLLLLGTLAVLIGVLAVGAAERSTARGGGIMSPLAVLPLAFGVPVVMLALCSVVAALTVASSAPEAGTGS